MYSFEGDFKRRPQQSLGGASKKVDRDELLQKAAEERRQRETSRLKVLAAIKIQSFVRGALAQHKQKCLQRQSFDELKQTLSKELGFLENSTGLGVLLQKLIFFYSSKEDSQRLSWLSQVFLKHGQLVARCVLNNTGQWSYRIQQLLKLNLSHMVSEVDSGSSVAVPLRLVEVYTDPQTYDDGDNIDLVTSVLHVFWSYLASTGYFKQLKVVLEHRVPSSLETSCKPPTPFAASLFNLILRPLLLPGSHHYQNHIFHCLVEDLFCEPLSPQIYHFVLPALAHHPKTISASSLLAALVKDVHCPETVTRDYILTVPPSPWLLYSLLLFMSPQTASLTGCCLIQYLSVLQHLVVSLPKIHTSDPITHYAVRSDSDEEDMELSQITQGSIDHITQEALDLLNDPHHVAVLISAVETCNFSDRCLIPLCCICHTLLFHHRLAVHRYRLLYTLAFKPMFLRHFWQSVISSTVVSVVGSPTPSLHLLSRGLPLNSRERNRFLPKLTVFCALLGHLLPTLHDAEFYGDHSSHSLSVTPMPFTLQELAAMCLSLRDVCLGLIELAYPDTRPSVKEDYKYAMWCVSGKDQYFTTQEEESEVKSWLQLFKVAVTLLRQLYTRDSRRQFCPPLHWITRHSANPLDRPSDWKFGSSRQLWAYRPFVGLRTLTKQQLEDEGPPMSTTEVRHITILQELPFVVSFHDRVKILHSLMARDKVMNQGELSNFLMGPQIHLLVRRNYIYEDAFEKLSSENEPNLKLRMRVQLVNAVGLDEAGIDGGGIFREFLGELLKTAFDPNRGFYRTTHDRLLYPNPGVHLLVDDFPKHYFFIGRMLGKAMFENMLVELPFAGFFLAKLLTKKSADVDIHHLASLDPVMYRNLLYLKTYDGDVADLGLDFTALNSELGENQVVELKPNGHNVPVTASNRIEYIHLMADYKLNKQIRAQCAAFKQGLANVIDLDWLHMFDPNELQILISGAHTPVDVDDLKNHTNYAGGYSLDHPVIQAFWKVVTAFNETQRRQLLKFVTSCSRPPLLGFKDLSPSFCIQNAGNEPTRLPTASTCMNLLKLPEFQDEQTLYSKLLYAIESAAGFELS